MSFQLVLLRRLLPRLASLDFEFTMSIYFGATSRGEIYGYGNAR